MKKVIGALSVSVCLAPQILQAQFEDNMSYTEYCAYWADFAAMQMELRQDGFPVTDAFNAIKDAASSRLELEIAMDIAMKAYQRDLEPTYRLAEIAMIEFREDYFRLCKSAE